MKKKIAAYLSFNTFLNSFLSMLVYKFAVVTTDFYGLFYPLLK